MHYIKVFTDFAKSLEPLSDAECGRLFMAMLEYAESGAEPEFRGNERFVWPTAKSNIDRDLEAYSRICDRNRNNRNNQSSPVVTSGHQSSRHIQDKDKEKDKEKDKDKDKENIPPKSPKGEWNWYTGNAELLAALRDFEAMRNKIKAPMTPRARKLLAGELDKLAVDDQGKIDVLDQSIVNNWKSVYPLHGGKQAEKRCGNPFLQMLEEESRG